jgi:NAD+ diphosphatase
MTPNFQRTYPPALPPAGPAFWFPFRKGELLVQQRERGVAIIISDEADMAAVQPETITYLGTLDDKPCMACEISSETALPESWKGLDLRALYREVDDAFYAVAGYAFQLLLWQHNSLYCPRCGYQTEIIPASWGKQCPNCGHFSYPPSVPAVLALVHDGERVLLGRKREWGPRYSILAGFVEPGESLEECVAREVMEEVGVKVTDITYVGSQPWPFPHQLMVGYMARYAGGEIRLDEQELDDAQWFHVDSLPNLPPPMSLARQVVMAWVKIHRGETS